MRKLLAPLLAFVAAIVLIPAHMTHAQSLHYSISAELPSNQINTSATYFDLLMKPNATQKLNVVINNADTVAHNYKVSINRSETNTNGVVDYAKHNKPAPQSLKYDIETIASTPSAVKVPAKSSKTVTVTVKMPSGTFSGVLLGGIRVAETDTKQSNTNSKGVSLTNKFAYVLGLQLRENKDLSGIKPDMTLNKVKATQLNNVNSISAYLENTAPILMHTVRVKAKVYKAGSNEVFVSSDKSNMMMAPNSVFAYPVNANKYPLEAGNYKLVVDAWAENAKYHWHFQKNFVITAAEANSLNKTAMGQKKPKTNWLLYILIALGILILLLLILLLIILFKRRKKDDDEDEESNGSESR